MAVLRTYACPECNGRFEFLHMSRDEPPPSVCELCRAVFEVEAVADLSAPHIGNVAVVKGADQTYRAMESGMGITDTKDQLRNGDVGGSVHNEVTKFMAANKFESWQGGAVRNAATGTAAPEVSGAISKLQTGHQANVDAVIRRGNLGAWKPT